MAFTSRALSFFRQLARHNEKSWFEAHRDEYEAEVREPMRELIEDLDTRLAQFAPEIGGDTKRSMFRIYRDIRFSKDKSPSRRTPPAGLAIATPLKASAPRQTQGAPATISTCNPAGNRSSAQASGCPRGLN